MINEYVLLFIFSVLLSVFAQIFLKISANRTYKTKLSEYLNKYVISAYLLFFLCTLLSIIAYKGLELKKGPILEALGYAFVLVLGKLILKEKITKSKIIGNLLIVLGIIIFSI